jgi:hypothetical protein
MPEYIIIDPQKNSLYVDCANLELAKNRAFSWVRAGYHNKGMLTVRVANCKHPECADITVDTDNPTTLCGCSRHGLQLSRADWHDIYRALRFALDPIQNQPEWNRRIKELIDTIGNEGRNAVRLGIEPVTGNEPLHAPEKPIFNADQRQKAIELLWEYLQRDTRNTGKRQTGWGVKTLSGLIESLETIAYGGK